MQSQLSRLKEQVDQESEQQQNLRADEARNQDQMRRLQRQARELEDEVTELRRKEAESSQRKVDVVCVVLMCLCTSVVTDCYVLFVRCDDYITLR